jgi:hypothetical protein
VILVIRGQTVHQTSGGVTPTVEMSGASRPLTRLSIIEVEKGYRIEKNNRRIVLEDVWVLIRHDAEVGSAQEFVSTKNFIAGIRHQSHLYGFNSS